MTDDGFEFVFQVVEQTEFIDDASFMPFKGNVPSQTLKKSESTLCLSQNGYLYLGRIG